METMERKKSRPRHVVKCALYDPDPRLRHLERRLAVPGPRRPFRCYHAQIEVRRAM
jgi:hypothetical protein